MEEHIRGGLSRDGGTGGLENSNEDIQNYVDQLADQVKLRTGKNFPHLRVVNFRSQVVAGTNYFTKVDAGSEYLHLRIFKPLPFAGETPELHGVQQGKTLQDPIEHFEGETFISVQKLD